MQLLRLWTDGSCHQTRGCVGGWAFVAEHNGQVLHRASGGELDTTPGRMELVAVIEALRWDRHGYHQIEVLSDSRYVVTGVNNFLSRWRHKGFRKGNKGNGHPITDHDLWIELDGILRDRDFTPKVRFRWVRGHGAHEFNRMADKLANAAATEELERARRQAQEPMDVFLKRILAESA